MRTIELIEKVKHLGLETDFDSQGILITNKEGIVLCYINCSQRFQLDMDHYSTDTIEDGIKEELFRIVCQYASTPIGEREIEPKYKLSLRIVTNQVDEENQLILFWDRYFNRIEVGKCDSVKNLVSDMKQFGNQSYKDIQYILTQKEWEEKLKTSWETITFIYQPIMIN